LRNGEKKLGWAEEGVTGCARQDTGRPKIIFKGKGGLGKKKKVWQERPKG